MATQTKPTKEARIRQMTICNKGFARESGRYVFFPIISLSGKWLLEQGFDSGQVIDITCEHRRLTITVAKEQRFERMI